MTQKRNFISKKKIFQNFIFQNFFFELGLDLILNERGTYSTFSKAQSQSPKKETSFQKRRFFFKISFFKTFFFKLRLDLILYERDM